MREIVQESGNRFDWWIMKTFNVLPSSPDFQNLTEAQKTFMWESYLEDNPKIRKRVDSYIHDDDFNKEWDSMGGTPESSETDESDDSLDEFADLGEKAYQELQADDSLRMKPASERINQIKGIDDWEEDDS